MEQLTPAEAALVGRIDPAPMLAQVEAWSAINSGTRNLEGLERQAAALAEAFSILPGAREWVEPAPVEAVLADGTVAALGHGRHLVVQVRPDVSRRLLLTGHMDTVFAADHPFQAPHRRDDGTINGPGVADMKGGIAVILAALQVFEASPAAARIGYDVLINSDEETGSLASAALIADLAKSKAAALTYEPSALPDGTLAGARGGSGNFSAVIAGRAAHAGRNPRDGRNAVVAAADLALRLKAMEAATLALNPARIEGGSANNVVPDHAVLRFNIRPRETGDAERFDRAIHGVLREVELEHEVLITLHGGISRPPKPLTPEAEKLFELVRACGAALGQPIAWQASGGVCDGNNIAACGVPVVDTMGVRGGAIHSADEFMIVSSLAERAALSAVVLHRLAGGE
ncbi:MAG TPA: hydrolase [Novosphingobium sp.]|nr:hydrolase [Novosphingobium sp.]